MPAEYSLMDQFDLEGRWGLPGWPGDKWLPGRLRFGPETGIRLELWGLLNDLQSGPLPGIERHEAIWGVTNDARRVSLFNCMGAISNLLLRADAGAVNSQFAALWLIEGEHLSALADLKYRVLRVSLHNLTSFVGRTGLASGQAAPNSLALTWTRPQELDANLGAFQLRMLYSAQSSGNIFGSEISLTERAWLEFSFADELHAEEALSGPIASLHYLLQLAVGCRLPMIILEGDTKRTEQIVDGRSFFPPSRIFFSQKRALPLPETSHPLRLLFTLSSLTSNLSYHLSRWYQGFQLFRDALDFYFSLDPRGDTDVAIEHHFLSNVNAVESYHRSAGVKRYESDPSDHEARIKRILAASEAEDRDWISRKLEYSNEVGLRPRLRELFDGLPGDVQKACGARKSFINSVVVTRNYLTHHDNQLKDQALSGADLWRITQILRVILQTAFLRQLGLSDEQIVEAFRRAPELMNWSAPESGEAPSNG